MRDYHSDTTELLTRPISGYMRLHHFLYTIIENAGLPDDSYARLALQCEEEDEIQRAIRLEAKNWVWTRHALRAVQDSEPNYHLSYVEDVVGNWTRVQIEDWLREIASYIGSFVWLDDAAILKLGVTPDVMCQKSAKRKHCDMADIAAYSSPDDLNTNTIDMERQACNELVFDLKVNGQREGRDYIVSEEVVALRGESGALIYRSAPYMLLTLGATRSLLQP